MGQYYRAVVNDSVYDIVTLKGEEAIWHGVKLMEHSFWNHPFCVAVAASLYYSPKKVAWVGDYATTTEIEEAGINVRVWHKLARISKPLIENNVFNMDKPKFLINNTKKVYVDLEKYKKESASELQYDIINPIPLLTAIGNDRGGGDFHKKSVKSGYDKVGTWAYNEIYLADEVPEGYTEEEVAFVEC